MIGLAFTPMHHLMIMVGSAGPAGAGRGLPAGGGCR